MALTAIPLDRVGAEIRQGRSGRFGQFVRPCIPRGWGTLHRPPGQQVRTLDHLEEGCGSASGQTWILLYNGDETKKKGPYARHRENRVPAWWVLRFTGSFGMVLGEPFSVLPEFTPCNLRE